MKNRKNTQLNEISLSNTKYCVPYEYIYKLDIVTKYKMVCFINFMSISDVFYIWYDSAHECNKFILTAHIR